MKNSGSKYIKILNTRQTTPSRLTSYFLPASFKFTSSTFVSLTRNILKSNGLIFMC